jgi:hypothetical protein
MNPIGTLPKLGLAIAVMENATVYGSTECSIVYPKKLGVISDLGS